LKASRIRKKRGWEPINTGSHPLYLLELYLLCLSHAVFVHLVAIYFGVLGKGTISIEVIPLAADLRPLADTIKPSFVK
jgi:hypothetical protein